MPPPGIALAVCDSSRRGWPIVLYDDAFATLLCDDPSRQANVRNVPIQSLVPAMSLNPLEATVQDVQIRANSKSPVSCVLHTAPLNAASAGSPDVSPDAQAGAFHGGTGICTLPDLPNHTLDEPSKSSHVSFDSVRSATESCGATESSRDLDARRRNDSEYNPTSSKHSPQMRFHVKRSAAASGRATSQSSLVCCTFLTRFEKELCSTSMASSDEAIAASAWTRSTDIDSIRAVAPIMVEVPDSREGSVHAPLPSVLPSQPSHDARQAHVMMNLLAQHITGLPPSRAGSPAPELSPQPSAAAAPPDAPASTCTCDARVREGGGSPHFQRSCASHCALHADVPRSAAPQNPASEEDMRRRGPLSHVLVAGSSWLSLDERDYTSGRGSTEAPSSCEAVSSVGLSAASASAPELLPRSGSNEREHALGRLSAERALPASTPELRAAHAQPDVIPYRLAALELVEEGVTISYYSPPPLPCSPAQRSFVQASPSAARETGSPASIRALEGACSPRPTATGRAAARESAERQPGQLASPERRRTTSAVPALSTVFVNAGFCRLTQFGPQELLAGGKVSLMDVLRGQPGQPGSLSPIEEALVAGSGSFSHTVLMTRKDGTAFWNHVRGEISDSRTDKSQKVVLMTHSDVSLMRNSQLHQSKLLEAKEAAEAAMEAKSMFLANMSHEIRTPLNGMIAVAELLLTSTLTPEQTELVDILLDSGNSLLCILGDILDFSRIDSGQMELDTHPLNMCSTVEACIEMVAAAANRKGLAVAYSMPKDLMTRNVLGDSVRIRQILANMLSNAVKFTDKGHVIVDVSMQEVVGAQVQLLIQVKDTGIGIPKEFKKHAFTSFHQAASRRTRNHGGTGLGLAISARLAALMNAKIWFDSTEGVGTSMYFLVTLPWVVDRTLTRRSTSSGSHSPASSVSSDSASGSEGRGPNTCSAAARIPPADLPNLMGCHAIVDHPSAPVQRQLLAGCAALGLSAAPGSCEAPAPGSALAPSQLASPPCVLVVAATQVAAALRAGWKGRPVVAVGSVEDVPHVMQLMVVVVAAPVKQRVLAHALQVALKVQGQVKDVTKVSLGKSHIAPRGPEVIKSGGAHWLRCSSLVSAAALPSWVRKSLDNSVLEKPSHRSHDELRLPQDSVCAAGPLTCVQEDVSMFAEGGGSSAPSIISEASNNFGRCSEDLGDPAAGCRTPRGTLVEEDLAQKAGGQTPGAEGSRGVSQRMVGVASSLRHSRSSMDAEPPSHVRTDSSFLVRSAQDGPLLASSSSSSFTPVDAARENTELPGGAATENSLWGRELPNTTESHAERMERIVTQSSLYSPLQRSTNGGAASTQGEARQESKWRPGLPPMGRPPRKSMSMSCLSDEDPAPDPPQPSPSMRILIAEDNKVNQMVVRKVLGHVIPDCTIVVVENGEQVLQAVSDSPDYDLILMDIHMPILDGLEATRRVKQMYPEGMCPKIVALSADTLKSVHQQCKEVGIDEFVSKPFRVDDMRRILQLKPLDKK